MSCKFCSLPATRFHAAHSSGELENLCELHYFTWHPEHAQIQAPYCPDCRARMVRQALDSLEVFSCRLCGAFVAVDSWVAVLLECLKGLQQVVECR